MKKLITTMLSITIFGFFANATNFYVDPVKGGNTNNGLSWTTAVADISTAITLASTAPYNVTVDNILVKQGTMNFAVAKSYVNITDNIYGSCYGNETSPNQRPMIDLDGNGIIEPWEFQYPTILNSTLAATSTTATNAFYLNLTSASSTFNGFTITHTPGSSSFVSKNIVIATTSIGTFENNIIKNCNNTSTWTTGSQYGLILQAVGTIKNCLFERNQVVVSGAMTGSVLAPFISVGSGSKVQGCIIRNNKVIVDYSTVTTAFLKPTSGLKGMIVNMESANTSLVSTISKSIIYNNEAEFKSGAAVQNLSNASIISLSAASGASCTDSIINCTVVNNKTTKMQTAGIAVQTLAGLSSFIFNNAIWNNHNTDSLSNSVVNNFYANGIITAGLISNNVYNGGANANINTVGTFVVNNLNNLDNSNTTATFGPQFTTPTTIVGNTTDGSSELAVWTLSQGSYLIGKGTATQVLIDKAGVAFMTPRSAGAYEYTGPSAVESYYDFSKKVTVSPNGIRMNEDGAIQIYSINGKTIKNQIVTSGLELSLPKGSYVIRFISANNSFTQKVVF